MSSTISNYTYIYIYILLIIKFIFNKINYEDNGIFKHYGFVFVKEGVQMVTVEDGYTYMHGKKKGRNWGSRSI